MSDTRHTWGNAVGARDEASFSAADTSSDICWSDLKLSARRGIILWGGFWVSSPLSPHWINVTECNYIRDLIQCWCHGRDGSCQKKRCRNSLCSLDRPTTSSLSCPANANANEQEPWRNSLQTLKFPSGVWPICKFWNIKKPFKDENLKV